VTISKVGADLTLSGSGTRSFSALTPGAGNLLAVVCSTNSPGNSITVSDNSGVNVWSRGASCPASAFQETEIWYAANATPISTVVSVASGTFASTCGLSQWSGVSASSPLDVAGACAASTSGTTIQTGRITTGLNNDLIIGSIADNGTNTLTSLTCVSCTGSPATWNALSPLPNGNRAPTLGAEYLISTTPGGRQAQYTSNRSTHWAGIAVAFSAKSQ
jgi:hypothetical protein